MAAQIVEGGNLHVVAVRKNNPVDRTLGVDFLECQETDFLVQGALTGFPLERAAGCHARECGDGRCVKKFLHCVVCFIGMDGTIKIKVGQDV